MFMVKRIFRDASTQLFVERNKREKKEINTPVKLRYQQRCWKKPEISISMSVVGDLAVNQSQHWTVGKHRCGKHLKIIIQMEDNQ